MMGSGKSTVGRFVAEMTGWGFVDSDRLIEQELGASIPEVFRRDGEEAFRMYEAEVLKKVAASPGPLVASVGGGAPLRAANRDVMRRSGVVVWLRASAETLTARLGRGDGRPVLAQGVDEPLSKRVERLLAEREPAYLQVAHVTVVVDHCHARQVARTVLRRLDLANLDGC